MPLSTSERFPEIRDALRALCADFPDACHRRAGAERRFRQTRRYPVAPVTTNPILACVAGHVLGLPRRC
ncbi:MAG: hypothetical protein KF683_10670 [Rubrivivax sp.]|nr:hypothetical protein [Rubrivivax sp.]